MKEAFPLCKLCLTQPATKKNSHIISKFLIESMFGSEGPREGFMIDPNSKKGIGRKVQDSPKQNHILCPICEERLGIIERYAANYFHRSIRTPELEIAQPLIVSSHRDAVPYIMVPGLDDYRFRIFIYSLLWRASVSNADGFRTLKLKNKDEERLRIILFNLLPITPMAVEKEISVNSDYPLTYLPFILSTPEKITSATQNFLGAFNHNENDAILFLNEYLLIIYLDWRATPEGSPQFNLPKSSLALSIVSEEYWDWQNNKLAKWLANVYHDSRQSKMT